MDHSGQPNTAPPSYTPKQAQPEFDRNQQPLPHAQVQNVVPLEQLDDHTAPIQCPYCGERANTKVFQDSSTTTHVAAVLCFLLTCCGVICPYICHWCENTEHRCSKCGARVVWKPHDSPAQPIYPSGPPQNVQPMHYPSAAPRIPEPAAASNSTELEEMRRRLEAAEHQISSYQSQQPDNPPPKA